MQKPTKYIGYLDLYMHFTFEDDSETCVHYSADFHRPDGIKAAMDEIPETFANVMEKEFHKKPRSCSFIPRQMYDTWQEVHKDNVGETIVIDYDENTYKVTKESNRGSDKENGEDGSHET